MKLYHGILLKNKKRMLEEGVNAGSYWGSKALALEYTDCGQVIEIDSEDYEISSNETLVEHYADQDPGDEKYIQWQESHQTWQDSLEIFDSVIIEDTVQFTENQIQES